MANKTCWVFSEEPRGPTYSALVEVCCALSSRLSLVVRDPESDPGKSIKDLLAALETSSIERTLADRWPGTILFTHTAFVYSYRIDANLRRILQSSAGALYDWIHPALPEDPCFLRADGSVVLTTTAHERDAYFSITDSEFSRLSTMAPDLAPVLNREGPAIPDV